MIRFIGRRLLQSVAVLFGVTIAVFVLTALLPGSTARAILGPKATAVAIAAFNQQHGLDRPLPIQYLVYVWHLAHGDLGFSYLLNESVGQLIAERLPKTLVLLTLAYAVALLVAVPIGMMQAVRRNRVEDYGITAVAFLLYSMPPFWLGLILIIFFSADLSILPPEGPQGGIDTYVGQIPSLVLPVLSLALITIALFSRYMRSSVIDNMVQDYVRTARAKGASESWVLYRHVLRNSVIPIITLLGLSLPVIFSGALITEAVFNLPGMGLLFWDAARRRDYPVLLGVTLVVAVATVIGNLLADVLYAAVDPRVRLAE
jgi:peptide/nickel transport system permease protein